MPIVVVNIKEGRTLEQKRDMVTKVTEALCETMEVPKRQSASLSTKWQMTISQSPGPWSATIRMRR